MIKYDFDKTVDRKNTNCVKHDLTSLFFGCTDLLPMWIADMDIAIPDFICEAVKNRAEHPVYGYSFFGESYYANFIHWMYKRHGLKIEKEWICFSPGVVPALNMSVLTFSKPNDKVVIQPPVYPPFFNAVSDHDRQLTQNHLRLEGTAYTMDFDDLESQIDANTSMLILCNPHNPIGRAWTEKELLTLVGICEKNNICLVSDEIHSDFIRPPHKHNSLLSLTDKTIACFSPSKTFNLAGMSTSMIVIPDQTLREKYLHTLNGLHIAFGNLFGSIATEAAYGQGEEWYQQLWDYLQANIDYVVQFCKANIPQIKVMPSDASYLLWLDCRGLSANGEKLQEIFTENLKLGLNNGSEFGKNGEGFMRMNVACPRKTLEEAMQRLRCLANFIA
ncbi:MAG: PatB family C-S lyase [Bacteroidales bacterium]